ncbi:tRNA (adenosine(37)-N6)-threonylcarbamoyltransferase complex transferase subunit TsaD [bacterium]
MKILAIETSCDDTSCAIVNEKMQILANSIHSQVKVHKKFYGIVPEIASRHHLENINFIIDSALEEASVNLSDIDVFAFTIGPGLAGSLLVGSMTAKTFAHFYNKPLVPVNHLKAHIWANFLEYDGEKFEPEFPLIALLVSGGHTELCLMNSYDDIKILGRTRDDACGEAFDKVAKLLDIGYPGGPIIDKVSYEVEERVAFPRAHLPNTFDFSFSGLKTAALYAYKKNPNMTIKDKHILAASFQDAVLYTLVKKSINAAKEYNAKSIILSGGVAANSRLRDLIAEKSHALNIQSHFPPKALCTDNAAMVAGCALTELENKGTDFFVKKLTDDNMFYKINSNLKLN